MTAIDRRLGVYGQAAIKLPCRVATTAAITLAGLQTVDGVSLVAGDRVLVKNQASAIENGIYSADTGTWGRAQDFNGSRDIVKGTLVTSLEGTTNGASLWRVTTADPVIIGTSAIAFGLAAGITAPFASVLDYGALGIGAGGSVADTAAFLAAAAAQGTILVPPGDYHVDETILCTESGTVFEGAGPGVTTVTATHSDGPVFHFQEPFSGLRGIKVAASAARTAGAAGSNFGVLQQGIDSEAGRPQKCFFEDFEVTGQPSHGLVMIGYCYQTRVVNHDINNNGGHGIVLDNGTLTGRSNLARPGLVDIGPGVISDNVGHSIRCGGIAETTNLGVRVVISNVDCFRNALSGSVRESASDMWLFTEGSTVRDCGIGGFDDDTLPAIEAVRIGGRSNRFVNNRYILVAGQVATVMHTAELSARDILFDQFGGLATAGQAALDPAVVVEAGGQFITVNARLRTNITRPMAMDDDTNVPGGMVDGREIVFKRATQTVNDSDTVADDAELFFPVRAGERVSFRAHVRHIGNTTANFKSTFSGPAGATIRYTNEGGLTYDAADAVGIATVLAETISNTIGGSTSERAVTFSGTAKIDATAGNVRFRWAQGTATVVDTQVIGGDLGGSYIEVMRGLE